MFGPTLSHQLLLELQRLHARGLMHLNSTHLVAPSGRTQLLQKAHIWEAELTLDASVRAEAPLLAQLDEQAASLATMVNLFVPQLRLESHAIKLQHNEGAWCHAAACAWLPAHACVLSVTRAGCSPAAASCRLHTTHNPMHCVGEQSPQAAVAASQSMLTAMRRMTVGGSLRLCI